MSLQAVSILDSLGQHRELDGAKRFVVAFSGGLDSTVLLDLLRLALPRRRNAALLAVHADHNLHPESGVWAGQCRELAGRLGASFALSSLSVATGDGQSPEAAARAARYTALSRHLGPGDVLVTAHHRDDQFETVLLQLLRGSGVAGLAGMPALALFGSGWLWRPLLPYSRRDLLRYAGDNGLEWLDDPSNADRRFDRNFLRHEALPLLEGRWPAAAAAVARSAGHCAEAAALMREIAVADVAAVTAANDTVTVSGLLSLSAARRRNALRGWIAASGLPPPNSAHLDQAIALLHAERATGCVSWPGTELRRYRDRLFVMAPLAAAPTDFSASLAPDSTVVLPHGLGRLHAVSRPVGTGSPRRPGVAMSVRFRSGGGETIRPRGSARRRKLRNLYQESGVVPWMRDRIPLIYAGQRLMAVADLWQEHELAGAEGIAGLDLNWDNHPRLY